MEYTIVPTASGLLRGLLGTLARLPGGALLALALASAGLTGGALLGGLQKWLLSQMHTKIIEAKQLPICNAGFLCPYHDCECEDAIIFLPTGSESVDHGATKKLMDHQFNDTKDHHPTYHNLPTLSPYDIRHGDCWMDQIKIACIQQGEIARPAALGLTWVLCEKMTDAEV